MKIKLEPLKPALCVAADDLHVLVRLQSDSTNEGPRVPLNLALVIDRSGSMGGPRLEAAKECALDLVNRLADDDRVALVTYDGAVQTVLELSPVQMARPIAQHAISQVRSGGSTDLHAGWQRGAALLAPSAIDSAVCHVILLSDGHANRGLTEAGEIARIIGDLADRGITTTTVGIGTGFNEHLMTEMAQAGRGRAHYGERAIDLAETFDAEIGLLTQLQWRNIRMDIEDARADVQMMNRYIRTEAGWQMPSVATDSECWAMLRIPMDRARRQQGRYGTALTIVVQATDAQGRPHEYRASLDTLPEIDWIEYGNLPENPLVARRRLELQAAELQFRIRDAVQRWEWHEAEALFEELERLGRHEPWIAASLPYLRRLIAERDQVRTSKELNYKGISLGMRLAAVNETAFTEEGAAKEAAFLRRKSISGRRTGGQ
jgi:Ca-activated chloride channel family protein